MPPGRVGVKEPLCPVWGKSSVDFMGMKKSIYVRKEGPASRGASNCACGKGHSVFSLPIIEYFPVVVKGRVNLAVPVGHRATGAWIGRCVFSPKAQIKRGHQAGFGG